MQNTLLEGYSDKPRPVFYGGLGEGYGIELEVDDGDQEARCAYELCKIEEIYLSMMVLCIGELRYNPPGQYRISSQHNAL